MPATPLTALILFVAFLISSLFGFGSALFAMPLLTLLLGVKTAAPLFGLVGPTAAALILATNWRLVELTSTWRLIAATWLGIPIGVLLLQQLEGDIVIRLLGIFLIGYGLYHLSRARLPQIRSTHWALPFGLVAGILGGAYNTNGPPIVLYGNMRRWPPKTFRATLQSYFFPTGLGILISHGIGGLWTAEIFQLYSISLPGVLLAVWLGGWMNHRLSMERFEALLAVFLIFLGGLLWL